MRDTVIMALTETTVEDISQPGGKMNLHAEVLQSGSTRASTDDKLMNVYFSDLVVQ